MPKYRRESVPIATPVRTAGGTAWSHVVHSHHYRSESNKKIVAPEVDRFFQRVYVLEIVVAFSFSSWFMFTAGLWLLGWPLAIAAVWWLLRL